MARFTMLPPLNLRGGRRRQARGAHGRRPRCSELMLVPLLCPHGATATVPVLCCAVLVLCWCCAGAVLVLCWCCAGAVPVLCRCCAVLCRAVLCWCCAVLVLCCAVLVLWCACLWMGAECTPGGFTTARKSSHSCTTS